MLSDSVESRLPLLVIKLEIAKNYSRWLGFESKMVIWKPLGALISLFKKKNWTPGLASNSEKFKLERRCISIKTVWLHICGNSEHVPQHPEHICYLSGRFHETIEFIRKLWLRNKRVFFPCLVPISTRENYGNQIRIVIWFHLRYDLRSNFAFFCFFSIHLILKYAFVFNIF